MKRILHLTLKLKWFVEIAEERKKHEYREAKPYWRTRLLRGHLTSYTKVMKYRVREFDEIHFKNGYTKDKPFMRVEWIKMTTFKVGGVVDMFDIHLGKVLEIRNYKKESISK